MEYKALKDIAKITMGQSPDSSSYNEEKEGLPFFQGNADFGELYPNERVWCNEPKKVAEPGDILISVRAPIGALNYAKDKCCIGRGLAAITIKDEAERNYVFHLLKARNNDLNQKGTGSTFKAIGKNVLEELAVPQISRDEQQKCMDMMDLLESIIRERKSQLDKLDELIKARFVEMFGDPMLNPKNFVVKTIDQVAVLNKGITYSPKDVADNGMIVLRSSNIKGNVFDLEDLVKITKKVSSDKYVQENDILMCNRNGSARLVGKVAMIPKLKENMTFGTFMTIVRSDIYEYLFAFFQTKAFREQIKFQTAVAINQISLPLLASVKVPIPPNELIDEFADFVKQVDKSKVVALKAA
ncbi:restriction endonuclease subunit S [Lachnobacterium bovis]|uniref:Type I restriction enzyme, S subunit n=1 Tax=Lachnobacterium bovis DSM 14045 TaxID=1122142 RepID=A0A1H3L7Q3_9FIRM|nr:restriction endonuclease subunit S [Lachnobacterium bovis]SDY60472.1 type I restriction enzyme, S subunit [Lachnobacterium bovis DSM 14045]